MQSNVEVRWLHFVAILRDASRGETLVVGRSSFENHGDSLRWIVPWRGDLIGGK